LSVGLQTIESNDLTLSDVFNDFYVVPDYQREYVWKTEHVERLLEDIYYEFSVDKNSMNSEYFIGSIVVLRRDDLAFEIIDGQQRMTTLFIILCAMRDNFKILNKNPPKKLSDQIIDYQVDRNGNNIELFRIALQYEDSKAVLEEIGREERDLSQIVKKTRTIENALNAYDTSRKFFNEKFGDKSDADAKLRKFYFYLTNNVKLIRVKTASMARALLVFETINDRGVSLDSMDLIKNLLFMHADENEFETLKTIWEELTNELFKAKENPLRFLRYYILATYNVEELREEGIFKWFKDNEPLVKYKSDTIGLANNLLDSAKAYTMFINGQNSDGSPNRYLDNIRLLSGTARQHLILLLAGRHLSKDAFELLSQQLENLFFAYIITREPTRKFERSFAQWSRDLKNVHDKAKLEGFISENFKHEQKGLMDRFKLAFQELNEDSLQQYRIRYVLAKISQFIDEKATLPTATDLKNYINNKVDIEHILPQKPSPPVLQSFDRVDEYSRYMQMLGNLTLLEKGIDASIQNKKFAEKQEPYTKSHILLTESLGGKIRVGKKTGYTRAAECLDYFDKWISENEEERLHNWTSEHIIQRQIMLSRLALKTWNIAAS
jgi:uncharacterized protein with ParB-like and HNH nuclease domain